MKRAPERRAYRLMDLKRWRDHLGIPINIEPKHFPSNEAPGTRLVLAAKLQGKDAHRLATEIGKALWEMEQSIADAAVLAAAAERAGLDAEAIRKAGPSDAELGRGLGKNPCSLGLLLWPHAIKQRKNSSPIAAAPDAERRAGDITNPRRYTKMDPRVDGAGRAPSTRAIVRRDRLLVHRRAPGRWRSDVEDLADADATHARPLVQTEKEDRAGSAAQSQMVRWA